MYTASDSSAYVVPIEYAERVDPYFPVASTQLSRSSKLADGAGGEVVVAEVVVGDDETPFFDNKSARADDGPEVAFHVSQSKPAGVSQVRGHCSWLSAV